MQTIFEYQPKGSYKRVISKKEALQLHNQSGGEYSFDETIEIASKGGILILENEYSNVAVGTLYAMVIK